MYTFNIIFINALFKNIQYFYELLIRLYKNNDVTIQVIISSKCLMNLSIVNGIVIC